MTRTIKNFSIITEPGGTPPSPTPSPTPGPTPAPPPAGGGDWNFGGAGDWGDASSGDDNVNTANNMASHGCEVVVGLGDYNYQDGSAAVNDWWNDIAAARPPARAWIGSLGNHDDGDGDAWLSVFNQQSWIFRTVFREVMFIAIDTQSSISSGSQNHSFFMESCQIAQADPNIKWIVGYCHKNLYTSPTSHSRLGGFAEAFHPIANQFSKFRLMLNGHNHNYQRSFPIRYNSGNVGSPIITNNSPSEYPGASDPNFGLVMVCSGTGGVSHYGLSGQAAFIANQNDDFFGYINIDVINSGNTLRGRFFANNGQTTDTFQIHK